MATVEVSIPNLKELLFNLKRYPTISARWLQRAIEASIAELHKQAVRGVVPWKTGRLAQSFGEGIEIGRLWGRIGPTVNYAEYVYEGTKPHVILPRIKQALYWEGAEHPVKRVQHPGTKENRFLERMVKLAQSQIVKHFQEAGDKIVKEISKI